MKFNKDKKGFILLVSVLISGLLLSIGVAILNSTIKELRLSSLGRDSQFAFYAADSGNECALFWDIRGSFFPTSTDSTIQTSGVFCNEQDLTASSTITRTSNSARTVFNLRFPPEEYCVTVMVSKEDDAGATKTTIESRGYNSCDTNNPRRVERAIRTSYSD